MSSPNAQYDSTLGGSQDLPRSVNLLNFTIARSKEIQAMKRSLSIPSGTKLAFQRLPRHMRRRVMSHNAKRLPRRLREIHLNQLKKSGMPPKQKRPSRKHRRRPRILMADYVRRQRKHLWLETHLWHAKRFHMIEKWGYRLAERPCDKGFRACYQASSKHCLIQDISYISCVEICGPKEVISNALKTVCDSSVGLSIHAKAFIDGNREGETIMFKYNTTPRKAIGNITFNWKPSIFSDIEDTCTLWIWAHPSYYLQVLEALQLCLALERPEKPVQYYFNADKTVTLRELKRDLNRFRLTGPLSHAVLQKTLCATNTVTTSSEWVNTYVSCKENLDILLRQTEYWKTLENLASPAELSPHIVLSLIVDDPRFNFPKKRTKAVPEIIPEIATNLCSIPRQVCAGAIWKKSVRLEVKKSKLSNAKISELRGQLLIPGTDLEQNCVPIPVMLIQRPGNKVNNNGYSGGWDIIIPSGWGQPFWMSLILWGARAGGLRETNSILFESKELSLLAPDTEAGAQDEQDTSEKCKQRFFSLPPNKRTNYTKYSIVSPFNYNWKMLLNEWKQDVDFVDEFSILRDKKKLAILQELLTKKSSNLGVESESNCLVPVRLRLLEKGTPKQFAIICLAQPSDLKHKQLPVEPSKEDKNQIARNEMRDAHRNLLQRLRRRRKRAKDKGKTIPIDAEMLKTYSTQMRALWLPQPKNIRNSCSREVIGFVTHGDFSFTQGHSCAVGYVVFNSIPCLLTRVQKNRILVRDTTSRQYRIAVIEIIV